MGRRKLQYFFESDKTSTSSDQHENEIMEVVSKLDPNTAMEVDPQLEAEAELWKGSKRDGREGWFPRKLVEMMERKALLYQRQQPKIKVK